MAERHQQDLIHAVWRFLLILLCLWLLAGGLTSVLIAELGRPTEREFPRAFVASTLCLLLGSISLQRAVYWIRQEKQVRFRRALWGALASGTAFLGIQMYGLWCLLPPQRTAEDASLGVTAFTLSLSGMHAIHFTVAMLFVAFVTARAQLDRYDHEYYWGVSVAAWFWHFLGVAWGAILVVFTIAW